MSTPCRFTARMMVTTAYAQTVSPLSLNSIVSAPTGGSFIFMSYLVREMLRDTADGIWRGLAEAADRGIGHRHRELFQQLGVPHLRFHELGRLGSAHAARSA